MLIETSFCTRALVRAPCRLPSTYKAARSLYPMPLSGKKKCSKWRITRVLSKKLIRCYVVVPRARSLSHSTRAHTWSSLRHCSRFLACSIPKRNATTTSVPSVVTPYQSLTVGVPHETNPNERRVAATPQNVALLLKKGFSRVLVERGAGEEAQITDEAYRMAGAIVVDRDVLWSQSDILLKVRPPSVIGIPNEVQALREGATVISFLYPAQNKDLVEALAARNITSFAMDKIPRISRAQAFDALRLASCYLVKQGQGFRS